MGPSFAKGELIYGSGDVLRAPAFLTTFNESLKSSSAPLPKCPRGSLFLPDLALEWRWPMATPGSWSPVG